MYDFQPFLRELGNLVANYIPQISERVDYLKLLTRTSDPTLRILFQRASFRHPLPDLLEKSLKASRKPLAAQTRCRRNIEPLEKKNLYSESRLGTKRHFGASRKKEKKKLNVPASRRARLRASASIARRDELAVRLHRDFFLPRPRRVDVVTSFYILATCLQTDREGTRAGADGGSSPSSGGFLARELYVEIDTHRE